MYNKMSKKKIERWVRGARFSNVKTEYILCLPGSLPIPLFLYRGINGLFAHIPLLNTFSIMIFTRAEKLE